MSIPAAYQRNYDEIARDHVQHWKQTGENPFQSGDEIKTQEDETVRLIEKHTRPGRWLDAGCGMGDLLERLPDYERWGVDISGEYLAIAFDRGLDVLNAPIEKIPFPARYFDLVTATDVLEHVLHIDKCGHELKRVLKPGGVLIVRTPHNEDLSQFMGEYDRYRYVHLRSFTRPSLWLYLTKILGLQILEAHVLNNELHAAARR